MEDKKSTEWIVRVLDSKTIKTKERKIKENKIRLEPI
jgi:hypothetical protein